MKRTHLISILLSSAALMAACTGCDGMYLGLGGDISAPVPGGSVSVGLGTTVPIDNTLAGPYGWGWNRPVYHRPPYYGYGWNGGWGRPALPPSPGPGPGPFIPY